MAHERRECTICTYIHGMEPTRKWQSEINGPFLFVFLARERVHAMPLSTVSFCSFTKLINIGTVLKWYIYVCVYTCVNCVVYQGGCHPLHKCIHILHALFLIPTCHRRSLSVSLSYMVQARRSSEYGNIFLFSLKVHFECRLIVNNESYISVTFYAFFEFPDIFFL